MLNARFDTLLTPLSIDVSTGDAITPHAVQYSFSEIFDNEKTYELWAYNIETVMAEKVENHLAPRRIQHSSKRFLRCLHTNYNTEISSILHNIEESVELQNMWNKYRKQFAYASGIEYSQIMAVLRSLM